MKKPSYSLEMIQKAFNKEDKLNMAYSAKQGQISLGFTDQNVVDAIQALTTRDFYKSMAPTHPEFIAWQDVYRSHFLDAELYLKFQIGNRGELILSFKEK